jgi:hypothetical protein
MVTYFHRKMRKPDPPPGTTSNARKRSSVFTTLFPSAQSEDDVDEPAARSSLECEATPKAVNGHRSTSPPPPLPALSLNFAAVHPPSTFRTSAATTVKRKKSRPYITPNDDDSDGVQGDVDLDFKGMDGSGWANEGRRRSTHVQGVRKVVAGEMAGKVMMEANEARRHSVAV